jgi:hypothetical protein
MYYVDSVDEKDEILVELNTLASALFGSGDSHFKQRSAMECKVKNRF